MSISELDELTRAEQLFDDGELDQALELLDDWSLFEELNSEQKGHFQFLKGLLLSYQNKSKELLELGEQMLKQGQHNNEQLQKFDGLFFILLGLSLDNRFEEAHMKIKDAEAALELISNVSEKILFQRKVRMSIVKAWINNWIGNIDLAERYLEEPLGLEIERGITFEAVWANIIKAQILLLIKGNADLALKYTKKAMSLTKKIRFNHYWLGYCYVSFGVIHNLKCEYDLSFKRHMESLSVFKKINNNWYVANLLNNLGGMYYEKGDYNLALKYLEEGFSLWEPYHFNIEACLDTLIYVCLEIGDTERVQKYFKRLEKLYNTKKNPNLELLYLYNKALILKKSTRIRDRGKAEELFNQVIETENAYFEILINAYIHLCDLLLAEFRLNNNSEVLEELNNQIDNLLKIAEKNRSYSIFCNTFILQAKLALLNFDMKAARRFLTQAQKIAESYGITRLAMKISYEHDDLIKQSKMWENLKDSNLSFTERWKLAGMSEQLEKMVKKRINEVPEPSNEEPVFLLILSEGGIPFFSHPFVADKSFESHLFGGFLSTIDYFIKEIFSEGLDRAVFGDHTLVMKSIPPFFISYIFKGNSYYAIQKTDKFIEIIQNEEHIWNKLLKYLQANQSIQLHDMPKLDSLVKEIFVANTSV
jgi:tetratricopeptide (TPR) repeat protein